MRYWFLSLWMMAMAVTVAEAGYKNIPNDTSIGTWDAATHTYTLTADVNGHTIQFLQSNMTLDGNGYRLLGTGSGTGITVSGRTNITIKNLTIENYSAGIGLSNGGSHRIENNLIKKTGIVISSSNENIITNNEFLEINKDGVRMSDASDNVVSRNSFSQSSRDAVSIYGNSTRNEIRNNDIDASKMAYRGMSIRSEIGGNIIADNNIVNAIGIGIEIFWSDIDVIDYSSRNIIENNTITNCGDFGIKLYGHNQTIANNTISQATNGIEIRGWYNEVRGNIISDNDSGLILQSHTSDGRSVWPANNVAVRNSFLNNSTHVTTPYGGVVLWHPLPTGGNYWSNVNTVDSNGDGVHDTRYHAATVGYNNSAIYDEYAWVEMVGQGAGALSVEEIDDIELSPGGNADIDVFAKQQSAEAIALSLVDAPSFVSLFDYGDGSGNIVIVNAGSQAGTYLVTVQAASGSVEVRETFAVVVKGQVASWSAEGNAENSINAKHSGTLVGAGFTAGVSGNAFDFDGESSVLVPYSADFSPRRSSFSLSVWIKTTDTGIETIISSSEGGGYSPPTASNSYYALQKQSHTIIARFFGYGQKSLDVGVWPILSDTWHHIVMVRDVEEGAVRMFLDGELKGEASFISAHNLNDIDGEEDPLVIGAEMRGRFNRPLSFNEAITHRKNSHFVGQVDEVGYYNYALSESEIEALGNLGPRLTLIVDQVVDEEAVLDVAISSTFDGGAPVLSTSNLPAFGSFTDHGDGTGSINFAPDLTQSGTYGITVTAADPNNAQVAQSQNFTLTVNDTYQPLAVAAIADQSLQEGEILNVAVAASGGVEAIVLSASNLPAFSSLTDHGDGTGTVTLNPDITQSGTYADLTITATSGTYTASQLFNVEVIDLPDPPVVDAGPDQNLTCLANSMYVLLDGSASNDPDGGAISYSWKLGGNEISTEATPTVLLPVGANNVELTVTKTSTGASASDIVSVNIEQDASSPMVTINSPTDGAWVRGSSATISGAVSENFKLKSVTVNGKNSTFIGPQPDYSFARGASLPNQGANTVTVEVMDVAGNSSSAEITVNRDSEKPVVAIDTPVLATLFLESPAQVAVSGPVSDGGSGIASVTVNGVEAAIADGQYSANVEVKGEGVRNINVRATDAAGNRQDSRISILIDSKAPSLSITAPTKNALLPENNVVVLGRVSDGGAGVKSVMVNGVLAAIDERDYSAAISLTAGLDTVEVVAEDLAGRTTVKSVPVVVGAVGGSTIELALSNSTGAAIPGVRVDLLKENGKGTGKRSNTGADGKVNFEVEAGVQHLLGLTYNGLVYTSSAVGAGTQLAVQTELSTLTFGNGSAGIEGVRVDLLKENGKGTGKRINTDANGVAGFEVLPGAVHGFKVSYSGEIATVNNLTGGEDAAMNTEQSVLTLNDANGSPIEGVRVDLLKADGKSTGKRANTDVSGQVSFEVLPGFVHLFKVSYSGGIFTTAEITGGEDANVSTETSVLTLTDANGAAIEGARIDLLKADGKAAGKRANTDASGQAAFEVLPGFAHVFKVSLNGGITNSAEIIGGEDANVQTASSAFVLTDHAGNGLEGVRVDLMKADGKGAGKRANTDVGGAVSFDMLPGYDHAFRIPSFHGGSYVSGVVAYDQNAALQTQLSQLVLKDRNGLALSEAMVYLLNLDDKRVGAKIKTDSTGMAAFETLPGCNAKFEIAYHGDSFITDLLPCGQVLTVELAVEAPAIALDLTDSQGQPLTGVRVDLLKEDGRGTGVRANTDANGHVEFAVVPEAKQQIKVTYRGGVWNSGVVDAGATVALQTVAAVLNLSDSEGAAIDSSRVDLLKDNGKGAGLWTRTGRGGVAGQVSMEVLPNFAHQLKVSFNGGILLAPAAPVSGAHIENIQTQARSLSIRDIQSGLRAAWDFENSGEDVTGNGFTAELKGDAVYAPGRDGQGVLFDGDNDYVDVLTPMPLAESDYAVVGWLKAPENGLSQSPFHAMVGANSGLHFFIQGDVGRFVHRYPMGNSGGTSIFGSTVLDDDVWHHFAIVKSGSSAQLYIDGALEVSATDNTFIPDELYLTFGRLGQFTTRYSKGLIDDYRVYQRALSSAELAEIIAGDRPSVLASEGVRVDLKKADGNGTGKWAKTDVNGQVSFEVLPNFAHQLHVRLDGETQVFDHLTGGGALTIGEEVPGLPAPLAKPVVAKTADGTLSAENYPNPFNPSMTIRYGVPDMAQVQLVVYNVLGQEVRRLVDAVQMTGVHDITWDGTDASGQSVSGGLYLYRLRVGEQTLVKKMIFAK